MKQVFVSDLMMLPGGVMDISKCRSIKKLNRIVEVEVGKVKRMRDREVPELYEQEKERVSRLLIRINKRKSELLATQVNVGSKRKARWTYGQG
jgi:hypothetical protein